MYSVIIRIRNEEQHIGQSIQSCIDFLGNPEIVIVNDNSTDKSMYICRLFISNNNLESGHNANYCNLKIVDIDEYTPGRALNLGVKNCSFNNVIILSSHCSIIKFNKSTIQKDLDKYIEARRKFWSLIKSKTNNLEIKQQSGDMLILDNYRVLHGRTGYKDTENKRYFRQGYMDRDILQSKLKTLRANS